MSDHFLVEEKLRTGMRWRKTCVHGCVYACLVLALSLGG